MTDGAGGYYTIRKGDTLSSIARTYAIDGGWKSIYYHEKNKDFRKLRPDPNLIYPGDQVWLPGVTLNRVKGRTGDRTTVVRIPPKPTPTIKVKWSKKRVTPDHNSTWPPATPPTDKVPKEAKVELVIETTNVPDGTPAFAEIRRCATGKILRKGTIKELSVKGNKVIDNKTGKPPVWVFDARHAPWNPWDKPFFYFTVSVNYMGLKAETPKDFKANEKDCLRVLYWHYCVAESSTLKGVLPECQLVAGILKGVPNSKAAVQNLTTINVPLARYGSLLRNTYVFHMASHGNVRHRTKKPPPSIGTVTSSQPPDDVPDPKNWRSVVSITPSRFGDVEVNTVASVPSVPRYLFYSSTCLSGWEPSFANALIKRGCRNVLAFRRTIPDAEAPLLARKFYRRWANNYKLDPEKIPDCFFKVAPDHYKNMRPVLYGKGGGRIEKDGLTASQIALIAIGAVVGVGLLGVGLWLLLKKK
jgi:hypothetical protein